MAKQSLELPKNQDLERYVRIEEACRFLGDVKKNFLYEHVDIARVKAGKYLFFRLSDLKNWVEKNRVNA